MSRSDSDGIAELERLAYRAGYRKPDPPLLPRKVSLELYTTSPDEIVATIESWVTDPTVTGLTYSVEVD